MPTPPILIAHEIYRSSSYGGRHPLSIPRVSAALDLIRAMGWLEPGQYLESPIATAEELCRFHDADYVAALIEAERTQRASPEVRRTYNLGINGNPIFPAMFRRPATACGGTLKGADLLLERGGIVHHLAGGTHHGRKDRASGFCFLNDAALGILRLLDGGLGFLTRSALGAPPERSPSELDPEQARSAWPIGPPSSAQRSKDYSPRLPIPGGGALL